MKSKSELLKKHAEELRELELTETILDALKDCPHFTRESALVCVHEMRANSFVSVKLWSNYNTSHKLSEAVDIVRRYKDQIIEGEHWKDGCVSTWPREINSVLQRNNKSVMDGAHAVEIEVSGGRGFGPNVEVQFWVRLAGVLCEITVPVCDCWQLVPRVIGNYNKHGQFSGRIEWNWQETQTVDKFRKMWSEPPSYHGSYYLADVPNFESWASNHGEQKKTKPAAG